MFSKFVRAGFPFRKACISSKPLRLSPAVVVAQWPRPVWVTRTRTRTRTCPAFVSAHHPTPPLHPLPLPLLHHHRRFHCISNPAIRSTPFQYLCAAAFARHTSIGSQPRKRFSSWGSVGSSANMATSDRDILPDT